MMEISPMLLSKIYSVSRIHQVDTLTVEIFDWQSIYQSWFNKVKKKYLSCLFQWITFHFHTQAHTTNPGTDSSLLWPTALNKPTPSWVLMLTLVTLLAHIQEPDLIYLYLPCPRSSVIQYTISVAAVRCSAPLFIWINEKIFQFVWIHEIIKLILIVKNRGAFFFFR